MRTRIGRRLTMSREDEVRQFSHLIDALADRFDAHETIYHYTSMEGFKGIIASM